MKPVGLSEEEAFILGVLKEAPQKNWRGMRKALLDTFFYEVFRKKSDTALALLLEKKLVQAARVVRQHGGPIGKILLSIPDPLVPDSENPMVYVAGRMPAYCTHIEERKRALVIEQVRKRYRLAS